MELVGRIDGTGLDQQVQRPQVRGARGLDHGLVFGRVLVGLEQNLVKLVADGLRTNTCAQFLHPGVDLQRKLFLFLDRGQRLRQDVRRGLAETALASTAKVVRRLIQRHQRAGLLLQRGVLRKVVTRQLGKAKIALGRKFPGHVEFDVRSHGLCAGHQLSRRGLVELEQHVGRLDLDAFARVQLHLCRRVGLGEDAPGQEFAGFFK